jgi:pyruvate/2-oxoglutarate dehydrogenase complex dihydrolipoamide dehydrogenase (E3) component
VSLIEAQHGVLPNEDRDAAAIVEQALVRDGVRLMCCGKHLHVSCGSDGKRLVVDSHEQHYKVTVEEILVGAGRAPNLEGLGLESAGVQYDKQGVTVNERLQTTNPRIYAAGDVCSRFKFTHAADAMARIVIQNALFLGRKRVSALTIPWCTYTDPEVAHVGLSEADAAIRGVGIETFVQSLDRVDRAVVDGETEGFVKVHVREGTATIVGATVVARHAGDLLAELTLAITGGLGLKRIADTIHPYPTQGEAVKKVADAYNRTRLTPRLNALLRKWLAWQRR